MKEGNHQTEILSEVPLELWKFLIWSQREGLCIFSFFFLNLLWLAGNFMLIKEKQRMKCDRDLDAPLYIDLVPNKVL